MPPWVLRKLSGLVFSFFWSGKRELLSRLVVTQPSSLGGFSVVDVKFKVWSLLGQWVKQFASSPSGWVSFMSFWFRSCFDASPLEVFSDPSSFAPSLLPPFYGSLLTAWQKLGVSFSVSHRSLVFSSLCPHLVSLVSCMTTKSCYSYLLSENVVQPHCVMKFASSFGRLHWHTTWRSLSFFDLDRQVIDLNRKIAHGVLYTAQRLVSFGLSVPLSCFSGAPVESLEHLLFSCPLAQSVLSWLQSLMFSFSPMCPAILCRHVLFGFSSDDLCVTPRIFAYLLNVCKFVIWQPQNDYHFHDTPPGATPVVIKVKALESLTFPCFSNVSGPLGINVTFIVNGARVV